MDQLHFHIHRNEHQDRQVLGELQVLDVCNEEVYRCKTLELPWKNNRSNVSCIPKGTYRASQYNSPSKGRVFLLHGVPGRSYIEVHAGNFYTDIEGCILVGDSFSDINADGFKDVLNSRQTLHKLLQIMPGQFELTID